MQIGYRFGNQIIMLDRMNWHLNSRLAHLTNFSSPYTATIDEIFTFDDTFGAVNGSNTTISAEHLLYRAVFEYFNTYR